MLNYYVISAKKQQQQQYNPNKMHLVKDSFIYKN